MGRARHHRSSAARRPSSTRSMAAGVRGAEVTCHLVWPDGLDVVADNAAGEHLATVQFNDGRSLGFRRRCAPGIDPCPRSAPGSRCFDAQRGGTAGRQVPGSLTAHEEAAISGQHVRLTPALRPPPAGTRAGCTASRRCCGTQTSGRSARRHRSRPLGRPAPSPEMTRHARPAIFVRPSARSLVLQNVVTGRYFGGRHNTVEYKVVVLRSWLTTCFPPNPFGGQVIHTDRTRPSSRIGSPWVATGQRPEVASAIAPPYVNLHNKQRAHFAGRGMQNGWTRASACKTRDRE